VAAGSTYTPIATNTLGSATASVTFSSIPSTYTDLILICNVSATAGSPIIRVEYNADATNYSDTFLSGNGTSASSGRDSNVAYISLDPSLSTGISNNIIQIFNYANTNVFKTLIARGNNAANGTIATVGLWRNTNAINAVKLTISSSTFISGSTFTLYGITAA